MDIRYIHDENAHNLRAPEIIVPIICKVLKPKSVIDIGCGIGTFLYAFKNEGINDLLGIDGEWVNKEQFSKFAPLDILQIHNLEHKITLSKRYDLAINLEVAEHLDEIFAETHIKNLVSFSDIILFSAAIPGQIGQNHKNEQWLDYWESIFNKFDYSIHDVIRPIFWNNKNIARWYKQNMVLVIKNGTNIDLKGFEEYQTQKTLNYVHPEYFLLKQKEIDLLLQHKNELQSNLSEVYQGKASFFTYLKIGGHFILNKLFFFR